MKKGDRVRLKSTGETYTYAGIDGSCAKMMREGVPQPCPVRLWDVYELFEHEDGSPIEEEFYLCANRIRALKEAK